MTKLTELAVALALAFFAAFVIDYFRGCRRAPHQNAGAGGFRLMIEFDKKRHTRGIPKRLTKRPEDV